MIYKGIIYCYTSPSNKCYIGQTINSKKRKIEHRSAANRGCMYPFHCAIRKYGFENFKYEELFIIVAKNMDFLRDTLNLVEKDTISKYREAGIELYNISEGGEAVYNRTGLTLTELHKQRIGEGIKRWKNTLSAEERAKIGDAISVGRKKKILQFSLSGEFIKEWESASDVPFAKQNAINNCLKGKSKSCAGFTWRYKDNE